MTDLDAFSEPPTSTRRLGHFELRGLLGRGGMGEVYRAHDVRLGRDVAVKLLPPDFTADPDRVARFEREARLLAALNHPHIAAIYGVEEIPPEPGSGFGPRRALVLELVEGETLADRIRRGRVAIGEALRLARQVADALEAAHEKDIVHRDLKPANILVRRDGAVKVLDFSLAKAAGGGALAGQTSDGVILGTPAYMSPEQARGEAVDKRTDIWSFGCVLYEMLVGRRAFSGATASDTIAAILEREPDLSALPPGTTPNVRRVVARCLAKDPRRRMRDMGDARADLEDSATADKTVQRRPLWARGLFPSFVAGASLVLVAWLAFDRLSIADRRSPLVDGSLQKLTYDSGVTIMPTLSPDGKLLAYASDRAGRGDLDVWVQQTVGGVPLRLTSDPADDQTPDFSPDGREIVFRSERAGGGVYVVSALGGPERLVVAEGRRPRFSPDGSQLAYWTGPFRGVATNLESAIYVVALGGGSPKRIAPDFSVALDPVWSPDGRALLFLGRRDRGTGEAEAVDWWWAAVDGGDAIPANAFRVPVLAETVPVQGEGSPAFWTREGVLFTAGGNVWRIPLSIEDGRVAGAAYRLTNLTGQAHSPSLAAEGSLVFAVTESSRVIERVPLTSGTGEPSAKRLYADDGSTAFRASETADGRTIVFERGFEGYDEIWMRDVDTARQQMIVRVTTALLVSPTVSSDGARVAYSVIPGPGAESDANGYVVETAGGVPQAVCERCQLWGFLSDRYRVLAQWNDASVIGVIDVRDRSRAELLRVSEGHITRPHASGDERWLAFRYREKVYVTRLSPNAPPPREEWQLVEEPTTTGRPLGWSTDSTVLYLFLDTDGFRCVWGQRIDARTGRLQGSVVPVLHLHQAVGVSTSFGNPITADGLLYERVVQFGNLWRLAPDPRAGH